MTLSGPCTRKALYKHDDVVGVCFIISRQRDTFLL